MDRSTCVNDGFDCHGVGKFFLTGHELVLRTVDSLLNLDLLLDSSQVILKGSGNDKHFATRGADLESYLGFLDENQK